MVVSAGVPQLVVVGSAARDIDPTDPRGWRLGGGVSYGALLAGRLGARVGVLIGLDPPAREATELDLLRDAGVEIAVVPLERGPIFENVETPTGRRQTCAGLSDMIAPSLLPPAWRSAPAFLLAPVADEVDDTWAEVLPADALVGLAWQGLLRELAPGQVVRPRSARPRPLFARADLGGVSREDLRAGGDRLDQLVPIPGHELAITAGERGALHLRRTPGGFEMRRVPAVTARGIGDLVGAGDAFLTTWLVARLAEGPLAPEPLSTVRALHLAALVSTLGIERGRLAGLPDARALARRLAEDRVQPRVG